MTPKISLVAVCCSSASRDPIAFLQFFEQPHVLDGDDRLIGEVSSSLICAGVKGRASERREISAPMNLPC